MYVDIVISNAFNLNKHFFFLFIFSFHLLSSLYMCLYIYWHHYICVYSFIDIIIYVFIHLLTSLYMCLYIYWHHYICFIHLLTSLYMCLFIYWHHYICVYSFIDIIIDVFIHLLTSLYMCLFIYWHHYICVYSFIDIILYVFIHLLTSFYMCLFIYWHHYIPIKNLLKGQRCGSLQFIGRPTITIEGYPRLTNHFQYRKCRFPDIGLLLDMPMISGTIIDFLLL